MKWLLLVALLLVMAVSSVPQKGKGHGKPPKPSPSPTPTVTPTPTPTLLGISCIGTSFGTLKGGTNLIIAKPAGVIAGDVMVAHVSGVPAWASLEAPDWVLVSAIFSPSGNMRTSLYYRTASLSEPSSYSWVLSSNTIGYGGAISAYRGVDTSQPIDVLDLVGILPGGSYVAPAVTSTVANTYVLAMYSPDVFAFTNPDTRGCTAPTGMTERYEVLNPDNYIAGYDSPQAAAGAIGARMADCVSGGASGTAGTLVLRPMGE